MARAAKWLLEHGAARATLAAVPSKIAETAKQRRTRIFAHHLRRIRKNREWTQERLATEAKVRREQVVRWESGHDHEPNADNLETLCEVLEIKEPELRGPIPEDES